MPHEDFVQEYMAVWQVTFKSGTIVSAFQKSGIRPLNPDIFTDKDYAPSIPTSTGAYVPESYPTPTQQPLIFGDWEDNESVIDSDSSDEDYNNGDNDSDGSGNKSDDQDLGMEGCGTCSSNSGREDGSAVQDLGVEGCGVFGGNDG